MTLFIDGFESPIGSVHIVADGRALCALDFGALEERLLPLLRARFGATVALRDADDPQGLVSRTRAFFAGDLAALDGAPVDGPARTSRGPHTSYRIESDRTWATRSQVSSVLSAAQGGMAVPGTPSRRVTKIRRGEVRPCQFGSVRLRGGVESPARLSPRPSPRSPWQRAQCLAKSCAPRSRAAGSPRRATGITTDR